MGERLLRKLKASWGKAHGTELNPAWAGHGAKPPLPATHSHEKLWIPHLWQDAQGWVGWVFGQRGLKGGVPAYGGLGGWVGFEFPSNSSHSVVLC